MILLRLRSNGLLLLHRLWGYNNQQTTGTDAALIVPLPVPLSRECLQILATDSGNGCLVFGAASNAIDNVQIWCKGIEANGYWQGNARWLLIGI